MPHPDDRLYPFVTGELDPPAHAEVVAHLESCAECRRAVDDIREMHTLLTAMPPEEVTPGLVNVQKAGASRMAASPRLRFVVAAAVLVALATGAVGGWYGRTLAMPAPVAERPRPPGNRYMVLFYEPLERRTAEPVEIRNDRVRRFSEWLRPAGERGAVLSGVRLRDDGGRLFRTANDVEVHDEAVPSGLTLTGFVLLVAESYDEAARYVENCPIFEDGGRVELRRAF